MKITNEEIVYNYVMARIKYDHTFGQQYSLILLQHVCLPSLSARFIIDICDTEVRK